MYPHKTGLNAVVAKLWMDALPKLLCRVVAGLHLCQFTAPCFWILLDLLCMSPHFQKSDFEKHHIPQKSGCDDSLSRAILDLIEGFLKILLEQKHLNPETARLWSDTPLKFQPLSLQDCYGGSINCPGCTLHLHGASSWQGKGNMPGYAFVYSHLSAPGVLMGTGNVGQYLYQVRGYLHRSGKTCKAGFSLPKCATQKRNMAVGFAGPGFIFGLQIFFCGAQPDIWPISHDAVLCKPR
jgi:hypothetical protein